MEINWVAFAELAAVFGLVLFFGWRELRKTELARRRMSGEREAKRPADDPPA